MGTGMGEVRRWIYWGTLAASGSQIDVAHPRATAVVQLDVLEGAALARGGVVRRCGRGELDALGKWEEGGVCSGTAEVVSREAGRQHAARHVSCAAGTDKP